MDLLATNVYSQTIKQSETLIFNRFMESNIDIKKTYIRFYFVMPIVENMPFDSIVSFKGKDSPIELTDIEVKQQYNGFYRKHYIKDNNVSLQILNNMVLRSCKTRFNFYLKYTKMRLSRKTRTTKIYSCRIQLDSLINTSSRYMPIESIKIKFSELDYFHFTECICSIRIYTDKKFDTLANFQSDIITTTIINADDCAKIEIDSIKKKVYLKSVMVYNFNKHTNKLGICTLKSIKIIDEFTTPYCSKLIYCKDIKDKYNGIGEVKNFSLFNTKHILEITSEYDATLNDQFLAINIMNKD